MDNVTLNEAYKILRNSEGQSSRLTIEYDVTNMKRFAGPLLVEMESPHPHQLGLTLTNTPHNAAVLIDEIKTASIAERWVYMKNMILFYASGFLGWSKVSLRAVCTSPYLKRKKCK